MNKYDVDYHARLELLAELGLVDPHAKMRKLQAEALKYYPLQSTEAKRAWLSIRTGFKAADILTRQLMEQSQ